MNEVKTEHLKMLAEYKEKLMKEPKLKFLFLELTMRCNENCLHCGSHCNDVQSEELDVYTADGTLEAWGYNWLIKIDASETPQSSVVLSARGMDEDGYFSQTTGQYVLLWI